MDFIPFNDVWNNFVYLDNDKIVGGIKIDSINISLLFDDEQQIKVNQLRKVLNSIDCKIKILCIDKPINLEDNLNVLGSKIKVENNKHKVKLLEEDYDYMHTMNMLKTVVNRDFFLIMEENKANEQVLNQKINDLIQEFASINMQSKKITSEEWRDLLYVILNPVTSLDLFKKDATSITKSFKERIAPYGLKIGEKDAIMGDAYVSVATLVTFPSLVNIGWLGNVANINNTRMVITLTPTDAQDVSKTLKKSLSESKE